MASVLRVRCLRRLFRRGPGSTPIRNTRRLAAQDLQRTNALKNVLAGLVNGVAGVYFAFAAQVRWGPAALIAAGSILGAQLGARYGQRLRPAALRAVIVVVGILAIVSLVT